MVVPGKRGKNMLEMSDSTFADRGLGAKTKSEQNLTQNLYNINGN